MTMMRHIFAKEQYISFCNERGIDPSVKNLKPSQILKLMNALRERKKALRQLQENGANRIIAKRLQDTSLLIYELTGHEGYRANKPLRVKCGQTQPVSVAIVVPISCKKYLQYGR